MRFITFIFIINLNAHAYFIDSIKAQHAGDIGYYAIGVSSFLSENYQLEYFHGKVPKHIGGIEITTHAIKNNLYLFDYESPEFYLRNYTGINLYHVPSIKYHSSRIKDFPSNYYRLGSIRALLYLGITINYKEYFSHGLYLEYGFNDIVITNYYNNPDEVNLFDYGSLAIGYEYIF
jgi:hypothetical protein